MYTGSDSTDAQNYTQWPLNSSFQKMSNEHVDWAALAQQWIIMKEAGPPVPEQVTNPPPAAAKLKKDAPNEGGEAPMEVENECEESSAQWNEGTGSGDSWHWNQQQWNWNNSWSAPPGVPPPTTTKQPLLPTPPAYNQYPNPDNCNDNGNYGEYSGNYWSSTGSSKVIKPHNKRYSKVNVPTTVSTSKPINLDAAKRKQLPAWIREGLEKMERDKLKQLDKARENQEKAEYQAKLKLNEKNAMEILKDTVKEQQQKSKFESEAEESEDDNNGRPLTPEDPPLTQEDLMLKVRRTMTEILLKVTNREIYTICKEELQRHLKKMKASDQRVSAPSGANLSAKLGLGVYDASGSSSDSSDESSRDQHSSDTELKDTIKRRKMEFLKTEREIEDKLAEAEKHDGGESKPTSPNQSDIDSQVDAKVIDSKKNSRERTPPMKNNSRRKSRKSVSSTSSSSDSDNSDNRVKSSRGRRHSSTSVSSDSDDKYKRNSGSRTPEYRRSKYSSYSESNDKRRKYPESKTESSQSRRSRSRSSGRRKRSRSSSHKRNDRSSSRSRYRRSRSRSRSKSHYRKSSYDRSRRSSSRSRRSTSYSRRRRRSSSRRSRSPSSRTRRQRRSRSYSSGRGKRSHRH